MEMHFATVWEAIADELPDTDAIIQGEVARTWREYDDRAARLASALASAGLAPDSKVGLYLYNSNEYLEAQYGAFKMRGVPINVNYRYLDDELWYLLDNADAEALVFHTSLSDRVARVQDRLPGLKLLIAVDDGPPVGGGTDVQGAVPYEQVIATHPPMARIPRMEDDIYILYTGGTTGMPKGVMYAMGGLTAAFVASGFPLLGLAAPTDAAEIAGVVGEAARRGDRFVSIPACPLMHGTGVWLGTFIPHLAGGTVITLESRSLDPHELLGAVQAHQATVVAIVGDAFAKPILRALDEAAGRGAPYDTSSLRTIISSGVMWTAEVKAALLDRIEHLVLVDAVGSTEGSMGISVTMRGLSSATAKFSQMPTTRVFTDDGREVEPGSGEIGMVAAGGNVPLGYFKDPEKSARTFRVVDGVRYSFPGDLATVERGRFAEPARAGQSGDQHRRGEGVPRGGRGGGEAGRRRRGLPRGGCPRRALRRGGHRCGLPGRRPARRRRLTSSRRSSGTSPATRHQSMSSSSSRCRGRRTGRRTIAVPRSRPSRRSDPGRQRT